MIYMHDIPASVNTVMRGQQPVFKKSVPKKINLGKPSSKCYLFQHETQGYKHFNIKYCIEHYPVTNG